jgi:hypothetical protein
MAIDYARSWGIEAIWSLSRRFDQTPLDGEVQQSPIWAGRTDQGRVSIQQRFGAIEPIECDCRREISIAISGAQDLHDMLLLLYHGKAEWCEPPGCSRMYIRANIDQQGHHLRSIHRDRMHVKKPRPCRSLGCDGSGARSPGQSLRESHLCLT